jgi:hypothetical protein
MRRRALLHALGGAVLARATHAQAPATVRRIGALTLEEPEPFLGRLTAALRDAGYVEGRDIDLEPAFRRINAQRPDAVIVQPSLPRPTAIRLARRYRLPSASPIEAFAAEGGVLAYASNIPEVFRHTALYVDKIFKGSMPADLPVTQSTRFDLTVNLATARAIGLDIPPSLLSRADQVIE